MLTAALIASATFVIAALGAFRLDAPDVVADRRSGVGGFALMARSNVPLPYDLNTPDGREALGLEGADAAAIRGTRVTPLRVRPGDESSCLNLYTPTRPRILGATPDLIQRGGFSFSGALKDAGADAGNPWTLLDRPFDDGAIPVIGDEAAVTWQLHSGLGRDLTITDERGRTHTLRFVALLSGSVLQGELIISESAFTRLFPSIEGYGFFLIEPGPAGANTVRAALEHGLARYGFDVTSTVDRLSEYFAVQNTYLATFQTLGAWGLVLGTVGLAAVMLRNVWERRGELALMRALGFSGRDLVTLVLSENALLVIAGLVIGSASAAIAIAPRIALGGSDVPWLSLGETLTAVFVTGMISGALAAASMLRAPLIASLRAE